MEGQEGLWKGEEGHCENGGKGGISDQTDIFENSPYVSENWKQKTKIQYKWKICLLEMANRGGDVKCSFLV